MTVRFTTTLQPPFAVQDVEGKVVGFEPDPSDQATLDRLRCASAVNGEHHCGAMPHCIYVKIDDCQLALLPNAFAGPAVRRGVFCGEASQSYMEARACGCQRSFCQSAAKTVSYYAGSGNSIILDAGNYGRPWSCGVLMLSRLLLRASSMADCVRHAFSTKIIGITHFCWSRNSRRQDPSDH